MTDPTIQPTIDPEGNPFRLTHKFRQTGNFYRILLESRDWETGQQTLVICDDIGRAVTIKKLLFYRDFEYQEGGY